MTSHKDEALRLIATAKERVAVLRSSEMDWSFEHRSALLALDMASECVEAIEELSRPRRAKKGPALADSAGKEAVNGRRCGPR